MNVLKLCFVSLIMLMNTCEQGSNEKQLFDSQWNLTAINGQAVEAEKIPTIQFVAEGTKVNGFAGCNRFFGTYTLKEGGISFSAMGATKMMCQESMELENKYLGAFEKVDSYVIENGSLSLKQGDETVMTFAAAAK